MPKKFSVELLCQSNFFVGLSCQRIFLFQYYAKEKFADKYPNSRNAQKVNENVYFYCRNVVSRVHNVAELHESLHEIKNS